MQKGLAPIGPDGKPMNLHHMTQRHQGAIAEMTQSFHKSNHKTIHINPPSIPIGANLTNGALITGRIELTIFKELQT